MNSATASYQESSNFIHHRYEDTAHTIFSQQQKVRQDEKRREKQRTHTNPQNQLAVTFPYKESDINRYGNRAVLAAETDVKSTTNSEKSASPPKTVTQPTAKPKVLTKPKETIKTKEPIKTKDTVKSNDSARPKDLNNSVEGRVVKPPGQATIKSSVCIIT